MSQATFQGPQPDLSLPQVGLGGPGSTLAGPGSDVAGPTSAPVDANQVANQQQLDAITAAQMQSDQQKQQKPDTSHGWSLTNPLQDIGQIWHDVETHTIAPAFHLAAWATTNLVKRPYTAIALYSGHNDYMLKNDPSHANSSWFQGSLWQQAWDESANISPGRATILAANDQPVDWSEGHQFVDPMDPVKREAYLSDKNNPLHPGMGLASGSIDAAIDWYGDPVNHLTKLSDALKIAKNGPIKFTDTSAERIAKLNNPSSAQFDQDVAEGKLGFNELAEHPLVRGTREAPNPLPNQTAALLAGMKTPEQVRLVRQVLAGVPEAGEYVAGVASQNAEGAAAAMDKLSGINLDAVYQAANMVTPIEQGLQYALTAGSDAEREAFLQKTSQLKAKAAQAQLDLDPDTAHRIAELFDLQRNITKTNMVTDKLASLRGGFKYANTRDASIVHVVHNAMFNYPIRVYQSLTDRVPGLINHGADNAVEYVRTWLNKSSTLTPEQKIEYTQKYASANMAERQRTWNDIENSVYRNVGDSFGLSADTMQKILTTTRKKNQSIYQAVKSRAYGDVKLPDGTSTTVFPSDDESIILHPQFVTQIEQGAMPLANLKQLETALTRMQDTGVLAPLRSSYQAGKDTLAAILDQVYGIWKPATLITGHRAYNHIGDDFLRGVAKIGGMASINNLAEGTANFLRNSYSRLTNNMVVGNVMAQHEQAINIAKAEWEGLANQLRTQKAWKTTTFVGDTKEVWPATSDRITPDMVKAKKDVYDALRKMKLDFVPQTHRLGERRFRIPGAGYWDEAMGGPNGDYIRYVTGSHPTSMALLDGTSTMLHSTQVRMRGSNFATLKYADNPERHTAAYVHVVRNQAVPDPVVKQLLQGHSMDDVSSWMTNTPQGRNYMKALHVGDPDQKVNDIASWINKYLPEQGMRDDALAGKFSAKTLDNYMPDGGTRPEINANVNALVLGGDGPTHFLRKASDAIMNLTGTMPDDILVRHPLYNSLYKARLTDHVQSWMGATGEKITNQGIRDLMVRQAHLGARKDLQNLVYDVSRFNDAGHTLRFISPFFNAWFNALQSWSNLLIQNPSLLARGYQAKELLWNSPFTVDNTTGQKATPDTPWDHTSFVFHMPKGLAESLTGSSGLTDVPIDAKTLISPTYLDAIGNPGFGPLASIPANEIVKADPNMMNNPIMRSMLNNMVEKNSVQQIMPTGLTDMSSLADLLVGRPEDAKNFANLTWSIYQEQQWDYANGKRQQPPQWDDVKSLAWYVTAIDMFANRLSPLGFKPSPTHQPVHDEYQRMLNNGESVQQAQHDIYTKYGAAGMAFTQSLATNPSGIPATVGASGLAKKYSAVLQQYPELGSVIVGPNGSGNFDQMAYDWQVAEGIRQKLTPEEAAKQAQINTGWAQYSRVLAAAQAKLQARGLTSMNSPAARDIKAEITNFVNSTGDPSDHQYYNQDFYDDYNGYNPAHYETRMQNLLKIANDPALLGNTARSDIRGLQAYSQLRDLTYAALQGRHSKTLGAAGNADIAMGYDQQVADLMQRYTGFAQLYDRYLRKDDWKEPMD